MCAAQIKTGGGSFDPKEPNIYFIASNTERLTHAHMTHTHLLVAINELETARDLDRVEAWIDEGKKIFIDSGVFNLAMTFARKKTISMDEALALAPGEMDGFEELFEKYVSIIRRFEGGIWGYIEIDQGGRENKLKTRARIEALGLRPIPVYHPLNDGWDYFDTLAQQYDRLCFGNIVQADAATRRRLLATMWQRHVEYPDLWIHVLGLTANEMAHMYPANSCDSSSWMGGIRWDGFKERAMGQSLGVLPKNFQYVLGSDATGDAGSQRATRMCAYGAYMLHRNWRNYIADLRAEGIEVYE